MIQKIPGGSSAVPGGGGSDDDSGYLPVVDPVAQDSFTLRGVSTFIDGNGAVAQEVLATLETSDHLEQLVVVLDRATVNSPADGTPGAFVALVANGVQVIRFSGNGLSGADAASDFLFGDANGAIMSMSSSGTTQRWGLFGAAPTQHAAIPDAAGGATVDAEARTAINTLLAAMRLVRIIAT